MKKTINVSALTGFADETEGDLTIFEDRLLDEGDIDGNRGGGRTVRHCVSIQTTR